MLCLLIHSPFPSFLGSARVHFYTSLFFLSGVLIWCIFSFLCFAFCRLASCDGVKGKPAVFITKSHEVYLGNSTAEELIVEGEVFGFNRGVFEDKLITGPERPVTILQNFECSPCRVSKHIQGFITVKTWFQKGCSRQEILRGRRPKRRADLDAVALEFRLAACDAQQEPHEPS